MSMRGQDVVLTEQEQRTLRLMESDLRRSDPGFTAAFEGRRARRRLTGGAVLVVLGLVVAVALSTVSLPAAFAGYLAAVLGAWMVLPTLAARLSSDGDGR